MEDKEFFRKKWYLTYICSSFATIIPIIFIAISMVLFDQNTPLINLTIPALQAIIEVIILVVSCFFAIILIYCSLQLKVRTLSFFTSILGIVCCGLMFILGIVSCFLISNNSPLFNGINLIWAVPLLCSSFLMFLAYKKDKKDNLIDLKNNTFFSESKDDNNQINNQNEYSANIQSYQKNKMILTIKDYNQLIVFSSLIFIAVIGFIAFSIYSSKIEGNHIDYDSNGWLIYNSKFFIFMFLSMLNFIPYLVAVIGSFVKIIKIRKKVNLFDKNNKKNKLFYIYIFSLIAITTLILQFSFAFIIMRNNSLQQWLLIIIIIVAVTSYISVIMIFYMSILAKKKAKELDYFNKSNSIFA